jgi:acyl-homoserine-lactone acylase
MKYLLGILLLLSFQSKAQIDPSRITIARDSFGVPHIFAPTDPEAAYGLAWAHAEDDFATLQLIILSGKAKLGHAIGKKGAEADYAVKFLGVRKAVESMWNTLSPDFIELIKGYIAGMNAYAKAHPNEIKYKQAFPFDERDYMTAVVFSVSLFCGIDEALPNVVSGKVPALPGFNGNGSNAFAFNSKKTTTGESFLAINAHQPLEGPMAFYEAHIQTDQGWNMLGGLLPGSCVINHGTNENLGWAHTVNYQDKIDVYQLQMNPHSKNQYRFDGEWIKLEKQKIKLHVKGIPITIGKKSYLSKYGPTIKTKNGVFSLRVPALMDIRAMEEWYRMNKAHNFSEFYQALSMTALPMFNITYADRYDTIFYISNGKMPRRNADTAYHWKSTIPGNVSATLWTSFKPINELPQYVNPPSGYLFNTNHSPFLATEPIYDLDSNKADRTDGYETYANNRSTRVMELMPGGKVDYETFKRIKFDRQLPAQLQYKYKIDSLIGLDPQKHTEFREPLIALQHWDKKADASSKGAAVFLLIYDYVTKKLRGSPPRQLTVQESIETMEYVQQYMMDHFKKTDLALGDIEKLVRGDVEKPGNGLPDVLAAAYTEPYKNGMRKISSGDAYICLVRYPKDGSLPKIESIRPFGESAHPNSPHYTDQNELFLQQKTKKMTLDKAEILSKAERIYHPG